MSEEHEIYEAKPLNVKSEEQFNNMTEELLRNWGEYKKLNTRMKILDATVKKYTADNNIKAYSNKHGDLNMVTQSRRLLDRSLINDTV